MTNSTPNITLYGFPQSTYVRTARMVCEEKGLAYQLEGLDFKSPAHALLHPYLKMPAADIDGQHLYETLAITFAIDGLTPSPTLQPNDRMQQAIMLQWISATIDYINPDVLQPALSENPDKSAWVAAAGKHFVILNQQLRESEFLAGSGVSLADFFVYPILAMGSQCIPDFNLMLKEQIGLAAWLKSMDKRPSAIKTVA